MTFHRIRTIKGRSYLYEQTNVRKGKKVRSIMKYLGALGTAGVGIGTLGVSMVRDAMGKDKPQHHARPLQGTDQRANRHQEAYERELYEKDRPAFDAHVRDQHSRQQGGRAAAKDRTEAGKSRGEKREQAEAKETAQKKWDADNEAVREFSEARQEKEPPAAQDGSK
jgi:hypothetical protein